MNQNSIGTAAAPAAENPKPAGLGRLQGVSVIASVMLPIVAAYVVFYTGFGMPADTVNQGELVQPPVDVSRLQFVGEDGSALQLADADAKWRYLILPGEKCEENCEQLLYTSRQVHIRLGEKADRVERLFVSSAPLAEERREALHREHPRLRLVHLDGAALQQLERQAGREHGPLLLLADQQGFAMMAYDNQHSGNQLLKDIKRLLKYSYEK